jgi:hypothetical protein
MGHGFRYNMSVGDASIVNAEAEALTNGPRTFVLYLLNCTALAFDSNALGERFLMAPNGGAVGVIGASREAYPNTSIDYNRALLQRAVRAAPRPSGRSVRERASRSHAVHLLRHPGSLDASDRQRPGRPGARRVHAGAAAGERRLPAAIPLGTTGVVVHVEAAAVPVDSALVCLWKGDEAYATGRTDATGDAHLVLHADTPGAVLVTVSERNLRTYMGTLSVEAPVPAQLAVTNASILDDGSNGTNGNGDGIADAGETVRLALQIANAAAPPPRRAPGSCRRRCKRWLSTTRSSSAP